MIQANDAPRRERVATNIFRRRNASGRDVFEIGYRDSRGKQRWKTINGGVTAARQALAEVQARKGRGELVQPNPRLRFDDAADAWLEGQVSSLRPKTQESYACAVAHVRRAFGRRRLDQITADDAARLVRQIRQAGLSESTNDAVRKAGSRVYRFAIRRMGWHGENPFEALERSERPKPSQRGKRRLFERDELEQTLAAATPTYQLVFAVAAVTGARLSEVLGLRWCDLDLADKHQASLTIAFQVDRAGTLQPLKTDEAHRSIEVPSALAVMLVEHKLASGNVTPEALVFTTRSGGALGQRNVTRALRRAQTLATDAAGRPTFPALHRKREDGTIATVQAGEVPTFHSFRHTAATLAIQDGDTVEQVSWQLGHKNSVVTRAVYLHEVKSEEQAARRRDRMEDRYGAVLSRVAS